MLQLCITETACSNVEHVTSSRASRAASVTPASSRVLEPAAPGEYPAARGRFASSFGVSALALAALVAVAVGAR